MGTGTHHHDTAFSIVKALGIVAVVISHAAILTPLETFTYYFNTAVFFFVAGYFFDDGQTAAPGRFIGRKLRRLYLPYVVLGTLFVLLHNRFLEWHLIAYDFSAREAILPYDTPELLRTLGRVFLFLHHEQMQAPFWFLQGLFLGLMLFFCITLATRILDPVFAVEADHRAAKACHAQAYDKIPLHLHRPAVFDLPIQIYGKLSGSANRPGAQAADSPRRFPAIIAQRE